MTYLFIFTFAICLLNFLKVFKPETIYPFFTIEWFVDIKISPTMWYFFYPSLVYQIWFWFHYYGII